MPGKSEAVAELVKSALERTPAERAAYLDAVCDSAETRAEVESLLTFQEKADHFIEAGALEFAAKTLVADLSHDFSPRITGYQILSRIGSGGMGDVFLAEDLNLHRKVALKLVRPGMGSAEILQRFEHEEQILASLNHPNIGHLHGAGIASDGAPFFVMEFIEGAPIDQYCRQENLPLNARLDLFRKVCAAVQYAHQHLVIHRDLKPSNILVTEQGEPKLLDFGIAKLLEPTDSGAEPPATIAGMMTPDYASPEQVRGENVTTASDVYGLGVLLYELLTGQRPYRTKTVAPHEMIRLICETEPKPPSTVVNERDSRFENRDSSDGKPGLGSASVTARFAVHDSRLLRGDLDNIVLMAMRKEPERRYPSVAQFSEDIRRHLAGLPVAAHKDTVGYRASKFIRRHKVGVLAAFLVAGTLIAAIFATEWEAHLANEQRRRAERRFEDVRRLAHSLMFEIHDSVQNLQGSTPTRRLIVTRALQYLDGLAQEAGDNPSLQRELATAYEKVGDIQGNPYSANLGDTEGALTSYGKAVRIREALDKAASTTETKMDLGRTYRAIGDIAGVKGDLPRAIADYRRSLQIFAQLAAADPMNREVQDELARAYETMADGYEHASNAEATRLTNYQKSLAIREDLLKKDPANPKLQRSVALSLLKVGGVSDPHRPEAIAAVRRGVAMLEALAAADPNNGGARRAVGWGYYQLGNTLFAAGDFTGALESRRKALAIRKQFAENDPQNAQARFDLAVAYTDLAEALTATGEPAPAVAQARKGLAILEALATADPSNAIYSRNVALCEEKLGDACARGGEESGTPAAERIHAWSEARDWYEKAGKIFSGLHAHGTLTPTDADKPQELSRRSADCDHAIAQLAGVQGSP
ncbi:MAG: protein kinase domain-containing protein [Chthoniobacterales bacterium]